MLNRIAGQSKDYEGSRWRHPVASHLREACQWLGLEFTRHRRYVELHAQLALKPLGFIVLLDACLRSSFELDLWNLKLCSLYPRRQYRSWYR